MGKPSSVRILAIARCGIFITNLGLTTHLECRGTADWTQEHQCHMDMVLLGTRRNGGTRGPRGWIRIQIRVLQPSNQSVYEFRQSHLHLATNCLRRNTIDAIHTHIPFGRFPRAVFLGRYVRLGCTIHLIILAVCSHARRWKNERYGSPCSLY